VVLRKLTKAKAKREPDIVDKIQASIPEMRLDHIVKERYPTFRDALKDMDDALSMVFMFADLEGSPLVNPTLLAKCKRLTLEWNRYVAHAQCLKKVFVSVKVMLLQICYLLKTKVKNIELRFNDLET
jgi:pescadillo protein